MLSTRSVASFRFGQHSFRSLCLDSVLWKPWPSALTFETTMIDGICMFKGPRFRAFEKECYSVTSFGFGQHSFRSLCFDSVLWKPWASALTFETAMIDGICNISCSRQGVLLVLDLGNTPFEASVLTQSFASFDPQISPLNQL